MKLNQSLALLVVCGFVLVTTVGGQGTIAPFSDNEAVGGTLAVDNDIDRVTTIESAGEQTDDERSGQNKTTNDSQNATRSNAKNAATAAMASNQTRQKGDTVNGSLDSWNTTSRASLTAGIDAPGDRSKTKNPSVRERISPKLQTKQLW
jgi:hypothetical protein